MLEKCAAYLTHTHTQKVKCAAHCTYLYFCVWQLLTYSLADWNPSFKGTCCLHLLPWRQRQHIALKSYVDNKLHGITFQKTVVLIFTLCDNDISLALSSLGLY